jgi:uncharacterized protein (DUF885 family)
MFALSGIYTARADATEATARSAPSRADLAFEKQFGEEFLDAYWAINPDAAIAEGYYKYADRLIVPDEKSRDRQLAFIDRWRTQLLSIHAQSLSDTHRTDWAMLDNHLAATRWDIVDLRTWQWDPSVYNVGEPFARILSTEFAPLDERLLIFTRRLQNVPAYFQAARLYIDDPTIEHTQLAIEQNQGALEVFGDSLQRQIEASTLSASQRHTLQQRAELARRAISDYVAWLQSTAAGLSSDTATSFRLGRARYEKKYFYEMQSGEPAQALLERAQQEKAALHERMNLLADQLWPKYFPNQSPPVERLDKIAQLIAKLSAQHVSQQAFFSEVESLIPQLATYVTDHRLLTLDPDKPLKVRKQPPYQRGVALAGIDAPGPYDASAVTWFNVMPMDEMPVDRANSLLREYNRWMLPILVIHEAIPGHYAQLIYANKSTSRIKSLFGNSAMIEGWAVYGERMMLESGYGDHTAEMWLIYSKWLLRSVCNAILDYSVHVAGMSEEDAEQLLVRDAFQTEEEAHAKWRRVQLSSVQLASYFAGYAAIYDLREQLKRERPDSFDLQRFNEQFLSYGNAPVRIIRDLMLQPGPAR